MRPKLIALLAVSALALVGCSAGEPSVEPTATVTVTATPEAEPALPAEPKPADMFANSLSSTFEGKEPQFNKSVRHKLDESYYMDRGEEYCDLIDAGKKVEPMASTASEDDYEIEHRIMINSQTFLCPKS